MPTVRSEDPTTSVSLIDRARIQDPEAWGRLCQVYGPLVYHWARRAGLQDCDAADIGQEVFTTVHDRIAGFRYTEDGGSFRGWLRVITRHKIGDFLRRCGRQPLATGGTSAYERDLQFPFPFGLKEDEPSDPDGDAIVLRRTLEVIQAEFEPRTWEAFHLSVVENQPTDEIARRLNLSAAAVRQAKYRVLRRLRDELGAEGERMAPVPFAGS